MRRISIILTLLFMSSIARATEVAPLTSGDTLTLSGVTLGNSSVTLLPSDNSRGFLSIQNISTNSNTMACTVDGTVPSVGVNGVQLSGSSTGAGGAVFYDVFVPRGSVKCIGSASSTGYNIQYKP